MKIKRNATKTYKNLWKSRFTYWAESRIVKSSVGNTIHSDCLYLHNEGTDFYFLSPIPPPRPLLVLDDCIESILLSLSPEIDKAGNDSLILDEIEKAINTVFTSKEEIEWYYSYRTIMIENETCLIEDKVKEN